MSGGWFPYPFSSQAPKYHGLVNQGATCYLNSVLQVLFMTKDFREAVERSTDENPDTIDRHLKSLFSDLQKDSAHTFNITRALGIDRVNEQHDAAKYIEKILQQTSDGASQIFRGLLSRRTKCGKCGAETDRDEAFWHLPLALVDSCSDVYSVVDGIRDFFRVSVFSGEDQMYCNSCDDKADATAQYVIKHHPDVLILLLKRFEFSDRYRSYVKINHAVDVPSTIQIPERQMYKLYAVVDHSGDLRGGHYTATIKDEDGWYHFNDSSVSLCDYQPFKGENMNTERSCTAQLLFYRKEEAVIQDNVSTDHDRSEDAETRQSDESEDEIIFLQNMSIRGLPEAGKGYDPLDTTLKFVTRSDDLDPYSSDDDSLRAEMSCGHAVTPESLTQWCRNLLDQGHYTFRCPAIVEGTRRCNKVWPYQEVRRLADLSVEEMQHFEDSMARMAAARYCEFQPCPQCKTNMERKDLSNLCVICIICTDDQGGTYQFCWQCKKPWKGSAPRSDRCDNDGCINMDLQLVQTCKSIDLPEVAGVTSCPSVRLCPTCGMKIAHNRQYCKNVVCPRCHKEFCFVCLKLKRECSQTSSPYEICPSGVAPRQTSIPVWQRK